MAIQGRLLHRLSTFGWILAGTAGPAFAQGPPGASAGGPKPIVNERQIKLPAGVATATQVLQKAIPSARDFEDLKGTPLAHKPFALMDPKTRRAVSAQEKITLGDGRIVPAGEYWGQLNELEVYLNRLGHSLRNKAPLPVLRRAAVNEAALGAEARAIGASHRQLPAVDLKRFSPAAAGTPMLEQLRNLVSEADARKLGFSAAQYQANLAQLAGLNPASASPLHVAELAKSPAVRSRIDGFRPPPVRPARPVHQNYPFNFQLGGANTFLAYLRGRGSIDGVAYAMANPPTEDDLKNSLSHFAFHSDATAGGSVFGVGFTLANATADFTTSAKLLTAKMSVTVVGQSIFNLNESAPGTWQRSARYVRGADLSTTVPIPIGPVTLSVKLGVHGDAGVQYGAGVYGGLPYVRAWVDPFVHTSVYAQAGAQIGGGWLGVEAGVGANMTLLNAEMHIAGEAGIYWFYTFGIREKFVVHNKMDMLGGRVYAYARFNHPCIPDVWNTCHNTATVNLFNWGGYRAEGDLFAVDASRPLN